MVSLMALVAAIALVAGTAAAFRFMAPPWSTPTPWPTQPSSAVAVVSPARSPTPFVAPTPTGTSRLPLVPWLDATDRPPTSTPYVQPTVPPMPPCTVASLSAAAPIESNGAKTGLDVILTNSGSGACYLWGVPQVVLRQAGRVVALPADKSVPDFVPTPLALQPGAQAQLQVFFSSGCRPDLTIPTSISIELPSGTVTAVAAGNPFAHDLCLPGDSTPPAMSVSDYASYPPIQPHVLRATLELPQSAVAGQQMSYAVLLTNDTEETVSLEPCPYYGESLSSETDGSRGDSSASWLNCGALGTTIAPRQSVHLAMVLQVPADASGSYQLLWWCGSPTLAASARGSIVINPA